MSIFSGEDPTFADDVLVAAKVRPAKIHPSKASLQSLVRQLGGAVNIAAAGFALSLSLSASGGTCIRVDADWSDAPGDEPRVSEVPAEGEQWPAPCEEAFEQLAEVAPDRLHAWVTSGKLDEADLSFAAEALASTGAARFLNTLVRLLSHESPAVREGAVLGLGLAYLSEGNSEVHHRLREIAEADPSRGVRLAARDVLSHG